MAVFVLADPHLSTDQKTNKAMDVFGSRWIGYTEKLEKNWRALVSPSDTVILPGDVSWALKLEDTRSDFAFLHSLPGQKYIGKGNHDFWWATAKKMNAFLTENAFDSLHILYNNAFVTENFIVCGSRGWFIDEKWQNTVGDVDFDKIVNRENIRLRLSLAEAASLREKTGLPLVAFLHFPPEWGGYECRSVLDLLHEFDVKKVYFGHIHGNYAVPAERIAEGIPMRLCSADFLSFTPLLVSLP